MNKYFKRYPIYLILRNDLPFNENKIDIQDLSEVERLLDIYYDIFPYITNKFSNYKLTLNRGLISSSNSGEKLNLTKNELYKDIQNYFNYSIDDINAVLYIDDNWNINCVNCENCYKCINCINCVNCSECELCFRCKDCKNTINRRDQENLIDDDSHFPLIVGKTFSPDDILLDEEMKN